VFTLIRTPWAVLLLTYRDVLDETTGGKIAFNRIREAGWAGANGKVVSRDHETNSRSLKNLLSTIALGRLFSDGALSALNQFVVVLNQITPKLSQFFYATEFGKLQKSFRGFRE
jgi:hypothetical protein